MSESADSSLTSNESADQGRTVLPTLNVKSLGSKDPSTWSIKDVATWLQSLGFTNEASNFVDEMISGEELMDLTAAELSELGIKKMGQRKRLLQKINKLKIKGAAALDDATSSSLGGDSASSSVETINVTALLKRREVKMVVKSNIDLSELVAQLSAKFGIKVKLRFVDEDGDVINVSTDQVLQDVLLGEDEITFQCSKDLKAASRSKNAKSASDRAKTSKKFEMFDAVMDGYIVIDTDGVIVFFNKVSEKIFGYSRSKVVGKNIKMLMPDSYARKHDHYLARYATTGRKHVLDARRVVMGKNADDQMFALELAVTEQKDSGVSHFVGVIKPVEAAAPAAAGSSDEELIPRDLKNQLSQLHESAIVIDQTGEIKFINTPGEEMFGYAPRSLIGEKIETLMPSPHKENHAFYLSRYVATGKKRVVGKSRNVTALHKDGSALPVNLALSEAEHDGEPLFIGLLTSAKTTTSKKSYSVMQMTRKLLNSMTVPGVLINDKGIIHAFNRSAEQLLGYQLLDVVGRNVSILMNSHDAGQHDGYLEHYLTTGEEKVIGKERIVQAKHKNGDLIPIHLSVTVTEDENHNKLFTGMMHQPAAELEKKKKKKSKKKRGSSASQSGSSSVASASED